VRFTWLTAVARDRPLLADALLALGCLGVAVATLQLSSRRPEQDPGLVVACCLALVGVTPIALRRWRTWWAVVGAAGCTGLAIAVPAATDLLAQGTTIMVVTYSAASLLPPRRAVAATGLLWIPALSLVALQVGTLPPAGSPLWTVLVSNTAIALVLLSVGRTVWTRRAYASALEDRARAAEANQQALAVQAVGEERRRVARELHDLVAHHISVMSVLASGARRTLRQDPAAADEVLETIERTGRTVLREMRRLLDLLRATDPETGDVLAPQPNLAAVTGLVEQVREAGLPVTLVCDHHLAELDPGLALTVYRIVQEALTNVLKHAGAATVEVRIALVDRWVQVEVADTGRGPRLGAGRPGHGLLGMHERVAIFGGTLQTGPRPGGGFRLRAAIPLDGPDPTAHGTLTP
jgi:signal transduction histidine kinase